MDLINARVAVVAAREALDAAIAALTTAHADLTAEPEAVVVRAGENLQAALDKGGRIELEAGAVFEGTYQPRSDTVLVGNAGSAIRGATGPALDIRPGRARIAVSRLEVRSGYNTVVAIGVNEASQSRLEDVPDQIVFTDVHIPTHRGVRGFAVHGSHVQLFDCSVRDCFDPAQQDSQGVYIGNTPGPVQIRSGYYSAGSEIILLGGDTTRIPHVCPTDVLIESVTVERPAAEQHDGIYRKRKNSIEAKNAHRLTVRWCTIDGSWTGGGQQGEAFVFTPDLDGGRRDPPLQSGQVTEVLVEDCTVRNCSTLAGLRGRSYNSFTPQPLTVTFRRVNAQLSRATCGGRGQLATIGGEPGSVSFEDCDITQDGTSLIYYDPGTVIDPETKLSRMSGRIGKLTMVNSRSTCPAYGLNLGGFPNALNHPVSVAALTVTGNTFTGSTTMQKTLPENTYR